MTITKEQALADRLRKLAPGRTEWRVQHPVEKCYCISFGRNHTLHPERAAREWLANFQREHPHHEHAKYEVAEVRCFTELEQAALEAAELLAQSPAQPDAQPIVAHSKRQYKRLDSLGANVVPPLRTSLDVTITKDEAEYIAAFIADENERDDDVVRLMAGDGHSGYGLYAAHPEYLDEGAILIKNLPAPPAAQQQQERPAGDVATQPEALNFNDGWQNYICYLIDHAEGETVTEESLQRWAAAFLKEPRYANAAALSSQPAQQAGDVDGSPGVNAAHGLSGEAWSAVTKRCFDTGGNYACSDVSASRCTLCPNRKAPAAPPVSAPAQVDAPLPPMPEHDHVIHVTDSETIECFRADQMREYVLADRRQRAAPAQQEAQAAPLHGFSRDDLSDIAEGLDCYDKTVNVGDATGEGFGDTLLESSTAAAARFIRAALAAPPQPAVAGEGPLRDEPANTKGGA